MRYAYPCNIVRDREEESATGREAYNVTFPDVYGPIRARGRGKMPLRRPATACVSH